MGKLPSGLSSRVSSPGKLRASSKSREVGSASINQCYIDVVCSISLHFFYQAEEMIAGIKDAFKANLPQVNWMDEETKNKALNKVEFSLQQRFML